MHFEKLVIVYYILRLAVFEILEFEAEEFLIFYLLVYHECLFRPQKQYHFLKGRNENFQMQYLNCLTDLGFFLKSAQNCKNVLFHTIWGP